MHHATAAICTRYAASRTRPHSYLARADELAGEGLPGEFVIPDRCAEAALALDRRRARDVRAAIVEAGLLARDELDPLYAPALYCFGSRPRGARGAPNEPVLTET